ncbi:MAG: glycosyltransferase family 9 protein [Candidatus Aadella gelida]|nr:glycosyltransferase family 9 protein [Candidatus Aadella gelida]
MKKILIANIFGIGDVLFTTPIVANLKRLNKDIKIDYMCNVRTMDIVNHVPGINEIYVYEKDIFTQIWKDSKIRFLKAANNLFNEIKNEKYDALFDFTLSREMGLFFKLAGIKRRIGLNYKKRGVFLTDKIPFTGFSEKHVIEYYLDCLRHIGIEAETNKMSLLADEISQEMVLSHLREKGVDEKADPLIAVIPGGGASWGKDAARKRWSPAGFAKVADILADKGASVVILGDVGESDLCRNLAGIMEKAPALVMNDLTLPDYIAFLNACDLVLCNDGGPMHIAAALDVRTVSVFGPVDEKVYGPYPPSEKRVAVTKQDLSCRPCYNNFKLPECGNNNKCLEEISADTVAGACLKLLSEVKG